MKTEKEKMLAGEVFNVYDPELVKEIQSKLKANNGYCPCSLFQDKEHKCMCKDFREQTTPGYCHCGLYYKEEE